MLRYAPPMVTGGTLLWRRVGGAVLTATGVGAWVVMAAFVEPTIRDVVDAWRSAGHPYWGSGWIPHGPATGLFEQMGPSLRWAAILLAVGGLVSVTAGVRPRAWVAAGAVGWLAADLALDLANAPALAVVAVGAVVLALAVLSLGRGWSTARDERRGVDGGAFIYSGVLAGAGVMSLWLVEPFMFEALPGYAMPAVVTLDILLVVAAVLNALAAAPRLTPGRVVGAALVAVAGGALVYTLDMWRLAGRPGDGGSTPTNGGSIMVDLVEPLTIAVIVLACACILVRPRADWVFAVGVLASPIIVVGGLIAALTMNWLVAEGMDIAGWIVAFDPIEEWLVGAGIGLVTGLNVGGYALALISRPATVPVVGPVEPPPAPQPA